MMVNGNPLHAEEMIGSDGDCGNLERDAANERMATSSCLLDCYLRESWAKCHQSFRFFKRVGDGREIFARNLSRFLYC